MLVCMHSKATLVTLLALTWIYHEDLESQTMGKYVVIIYISSNDCRVVRLYVVDCYKLITLQLFVQYSVIKINVASVNMLLLKYQLLS